MRCSAGEDDDLDEAYKTAVHEQIALYPGVFDHIQKEECVQHYPPGCYLVSLDISDP